MQISTSPDLGQILQSQLLLQLQGIDHFSSLRTSTLATHNIWMPRQVHGTHCILLDNGQTLPSMETEADAVICTLENQWIGVRTADCVPVLLYDPATRVIAAIHAGWRGTVSHIVRQTLQEMTRLYGCQSENLYAMVGPSISPEAFEVGEEVAEAFLQAGRGDCILRHLAKPHIDLWQSNVMDLLEEEVPLDHIDCTPLCTLQHPDLLFSARREGIGTGRNVTAIRLLSSAL